MSGFYIFIARLILGLVLGIILTRIFRPEWNMTTGAGMGIMLVAASYLKGFMRKKNK